MNIFKLDEDPVKAARYHHSGHRKMILECAQILSTAVRMNTPQIKDNVIYKPTHKNHPCVLAATKSRKIFNYVLELGLALDSELSKRLSKPSHKSSYIIKICSNYSVLIPDEDYEWPLAMPDCYKLDNVVESYRNYYIQAKQRKKNGEWMMYYAPDEPPEWMPDWLKQEIKIEEQKLALLRSFIED